LVAAAGSAPQPLRVIRLADVHYQSRWTIWDRSYKPME
jgi:hypothetical protein